MNNTTLFGIAHKKNDNYKKIGAWFLGAKAENQNLLSELITRCINHHSLLRENYYASELPYITNEIKNSIEYKIEIDRLEIHLDQLLTELSSSVPFFSTHYQAHMNWDTVLPGLVGYFAAMLYNQNNVATEASPVTSRLEYIVGQDLCKLLGFETTKPNTDPTKEWGHITADGTIANLESAWMARNMKLLPISIKECLNAVPQLSKAKENLKVEVCTISNKNGKKTVKISNKKLVNCTLWQLLNLAGDEIASLSLKVQDICSLTDDEFSAMLSPFLVQNVGLSSFYRKYPKLNNLKLFVPATKHYSWTKAGSLLGIGQDNIEDIPVDEKCRMDMYELENRLKKYANEKTPVIMVVGVIGSTEEGVVDELSTILELRNKRLTATEFEGINFLIHCDAAWGGYLRSMLIDEPQFMIEKSKLGMDYVPNLPMSVYAQNQYKHIAMVDTVTIDPHKSGFIPYPAGALCYRNGAMRHTIIINASYIHSDPMTNMGIFGIEGSKPGAAPAAVWLANRIIPLNKLGYGHILAECNFTTKLYLCYWITLANENDNFVIEPIISLPETIVNQDGKIITDSKEELKNFVRQNIVGQSNETIAQNADAMCVLQEIGSDVLINSFVVNYRQANGEWNTSLENCKKLNQMLFEKFSITTAQDDTTEKVEFIITKSELNTNLYKKPLTTIAKNLSLETKDDFSLNFIINTIMQPWAASFEEIHYLTNIFKQGIYDCINNMG